MMKNSPLFSMIVPLLIAASLLSYFIFNLMKLSPHLTTLFTFQCLSTLGSYFLLGIGLGLPLIILASMLGLGQILLLLKGDINPHLGKEGFFNVLKTLFNKI